MFIPSQRHIFQFDRPLLLSASPTHMDSGLSMNYEVYLTRLNISFHDFFSETQRPKLQPFNKNKKASIKYIPESQTIENHFAWFHGFLWETCKSKILFLFYFIFLVNINLCWKPREREPSISIYFKCKALSHFERKSSFLVPNISFWIFLATQNSSKVSKLVSGSLVPLKITVSSLCKLSLLKKIE